MSSWEIQEAFIPILGILLVMIPVAGLTLILTMRLALKPFVETLALALRDSGLSSGSEVRVQVQDLAEQMEALSGQVRGLQESQDFDRRLLTQRGEEPAA